MARSLALSALAALAASGVLAPASAQSILGAYVQVHGGVFGQTGDELSLGALDGQSPISAAFDTDPDLGFAVGGLVGYNLGLGLAVEGEVTFRGNDITADDEGVLAVLPSPISGRVETTAFMVNGVYQITVPFLAAPYVGVGAGYLTPSGEADAFDGEFAYQAKAGLAWPIGVGRIITEVTYLGTGGLTADDGYEAELDYGGISGQVGYRFSF